MRRWRQVAAIFIPLSLWGMASRAQNVVINEVLYDAKGPDAGKEYVELYNPGPDTLSLDGVRLEAGNGARPDDWSLQWEGPEGLGLAPGAFLWIGGKPEGVPGEPDVSLRLHLQNGPDAVRLRRGAEILDLVGWGEAPHPGYCEGRAAPDVEAGIALGRVPDGRDTGMNAADLHPLVRPSPGAPNELQGLRLRSLEPSQAVARAGEAVAWRAVFQNALARSLPGAALQAAWDGTPLELSPPGLVPAGETLSVFWREPPAARREVHEHVLSWEDGFGAGEMRVRHRIGTGPLILSEIQFGPTPGEGEWVELLAREAIPTLAGWRFADASGTAVTLDDSLGLAPGERVVLAQHPEGLLERYPSLRPDRVLAGGSSWPSLNDAARGEREWADRLLLWDPDGLPSDLAAYRPLPGAGSGRSLLRRREQDPARVEDWLPCPGLPSPGEAGPAELEEPPLRTLRILPPVVDRRRREGCLVLAPSGLPEGSWRAQVFDLSGRRVRLLGLVRRLDAPAFWWDGRDGEGRSVPSGPYVVLLEHWGASGGRRAWKRTVTVGP
jgi:hypothetical protein